MAAIELRQCTAPDDVDARLRAQLIRCWIEVSNAGGAAGFPFPPVDASDVMPVVADLIERLRPERSRLIVAAMDGSLAGWVSLQRDPNPLISHWGVVRHLQTDPGVRGRGVGSALLVHLRGVARDDMGLSQLHLAVRGGMGLEAYYGRHGWREVGRWPNALRFPDRDRDEVLMVLESL